jgi:hypothetical protein
MLDKGGGFELVSHWKKKRSRIEWMVETQRLIEKARE